MSYEVTIGTENNISVTLSQVGQQGAVGPQGSVDLASGTLTGGFDSDIEALGSVSSGTIVPEVNAVGKENFKTLTNAGAFTLSPPTASEACTILVLISNSATAGVISTSGFTFVNGDVYETIDGNNYFFHIKKVGAFTSLTVEALQ
jgi:hypothetical protein